MSKVIESFGKYVLLERLAAGGMAEVYLAKSSGASGIGKFLAIKRILPQYSDNQEFIDMFKEEAKIAVNLNHGNVVSIYEFGVEKGQFFLVMEFVEGQNLRQVLNHLKKENKYFSVDQIVYVVKEVAAGLDHAHRCLDSSTGRPLNITHRDMSPQNVMLSFEGEVKVVDFGIAKAESQLEHTRAGTIKGKFGYMSPEQADGQVVDLRTDIFSLGIVLWELLAGERLFTAGSEAATLRKIRECQIPSLRKINPQIPAELERICNKALARDKNLRYQTASAFHRDLNRFLNTQYPDFSTHDFSIFMKSAFSSMFLENKKKLAEYSKIQGVLEDRTSVTNTQTMTNPDHLAVGLMDLPNSIYDDKAPANAAVPTPVVNLEDKKLDMKTSIKTNVSRSYANKTGTGLNVPQGTGVSIRYSGTQSSFKVPQKKSSGLLSKMFISTVIVFGAYYFWNQKNISSTSNTTDLAQNPEPQKLDVSSNANTSSNPTPPAIESASTMKVAVNINSQPIGARVFIDGVDTGQFTPTRRVIEANKEVQISLRKDGYLYYERTEIVREPGTTITATLQREPVMGYAYISVIGGGPETIIYINGQRLTEKPPIQKFAVPANAPVKIEAYNPFLKTRDTQTVVIGPNQKKSVRLVLGRTAKPGN